MVVCRPARADGATVYVKFGERSVSSTKPVISWSSKPVGIDAVCFKSVTGERKRTFYVRDDGLHVVDGLRLFIK